MNWPEMLKSDQGLRRDVAGPGRLEAEVHQVAGVEVRAEDAAVDVPLPERGDAVGRQEVFAAAGDFAEVDPLDVGVVVGDGAVGQARRVVLDVAGLVDVFELVRQAVEVADDLGRACRRGFCLRGRRRGFR